MKIVERQVQDVTILDLHGKILIGEGDEALRDAVNKAVEGGKTKLLLNLADVPYVDSAGLGEIVRCYTTVSRKGGKLKLTAKNRSNKDLVIDINLAGFTAVYDGDAAMTFDELNQQSTGPTALEKQLQDRAEELRKKLDEGAVPPADQPAAQ